MTPCADTNWSRTQHCPKSATRQLEGMCVHEHLLSAAFCDEHAAEREGTREPFACRACREGVDPHQCRVRVVSTAMSS